MPPNLEEDNSEASPGPIDPIGDSIEYEDESCINNQSPNGPSAAHDTPSSSQSNNAGPTFLARLIQLPELRALPWRSGQELAPERSSDSSRVQQRGACLLATRGAVNEKPCEHCALGLGRFSQCITLDNWFQGACSSCIFTSKGNRCTHRLQKGHVDGRKARHQLAEEGGMVVEKNPGSKKRKRWAAAKAPPANLGSINRTLVASPATNGTIVVDHKADRHSISVALPRTVSPVMGLAPQAEMVGEESTESYTHDVENKQKRHRTKGNSPSASYAAHPLANIPQAISFQSINGAAPRLVPPSPANLVSTPPMRQIAPLRLSGDGRFENDRLQEIPLIDTLPKSKQRQIFGLISGIQGGIDHLQKQLNILQGALGMELDGSGTMGFI